ncbi:1-deoxy-D-xylulose-5-phosphate synthase N-terminal domain-containing protein, partial [Bacillus sp. WP8]|uniref:1-deoxy-D-xylulose-5-phosphate synthase N-terminal domain-containing protein n=1 Tax=Bacillus sp. WP8 TaxID=756828 RepID=UPI0037C152F0
MKNPTFLKRISIAQLRQLTPDIPIFLIHSFPNSPPHIPPNLALLQLTLPLHKVFHTPKHKFLSHLPHHSYLHNLLTGKRADFHTLRQ